MAKTIDFSLRCVDALVYKGFGVLDGVFWGSGGRKNVFFYRCVVLCVYNAL